MSTVEPKMVSMSAHISHIPLDNHHISVIVTFDLEKTEHQM
jgi:hypothetical protein